MKLKTRSCAAMVATQPKMAILENSRQAVGLFMAKASSACHYCKSSLESLKMTTLIAAVVLVPLVVDVKVQAVLLHVDDLV